MRRLMLVVALGGLLASSCGNAVEGATAASSPTTSTVGPSSTSSPTTTTSAPTTTLQTTSTQVATPREFRFWIAPPDGYFFDVQPLPQVIYGYVRPQATVTVNGVELAVFSSEEQEPDLWLWTTSPTGGLGEDLLDIPLDEGSNLLVFEATFADGPTMRLQREVHYQPTLQKATGYLVAVSPETPAVTIELATLEYGEFGIEQTSEETTIEEFLVEDDVLFVVIGGFPPGEDDQFYQGLDLSGIAALAEAAAAGDSLEGYLWRTIYPDGVHRPAPWEFLFTPEGRLQQATQFYSP